MQQRYVLPRIDEQPFALDWNGPVARPFVAFAQADLEQPVSVLFARAAELHAGRVALSDGTRSLRYEELAREVRQLGARIAAATGPGELVGILLPTSVDFMVAMLACFAAGRVFVPLDLHYPRAWIANVVGDAAMTAIVSRFDDETGDLVPVHVRKIDLGDLAAGPEGWTPTPRTDPDAPAFVLFTSGSTGRPKGIVNSQRNLLRRVEQHVNAAHISAEDRFLPLSSECTIAGMRERFTALLAGSELHLVDVQRQGVREILRRLDEAEITIAYGVPALLRSLARLNGQPAPRSLRLVRVGGDAVLASDVSLLRSWLGPECLIEVGYSSTEAPIMQWFVPANLESFASRVPIGYPLAGNTLLILDERGSPVCTGDVGELVVRSPYVALGRWISGACTNDDFPVCADDSRSRELRTGDLVRRREDGLIELVGRKDRQVKIRGVRIEPGEIEAALRLHPAVLDAAVLVRRQGDAATLVGYVTPRPDIPSCALVDIKGFLKERLAPQLQPQRLYSIAEIPRLPSCKPDVAALEALDRQNAESEAETSSSTAPADREDGAALERTIRDIWYRILDRPDIDRDADFFDLGGDSLATLGLMFEIENALGVELPVTMIYEAPTIASLAGAIAARRVGPFRPLVKLRDGEGGAPLFICHGIGGNVMELIALGRRIGSKGAVYAIQARGLDGREEPNRRVEDMATYYLAAIRELHPRGPYLLAGYSSGGLVALEMARRLTREGETVPLLVLLDTQTNARQWPLSVWLHVFLRRARLHLAELRRRPGGRLSYSAGALVGLARRIAWRLGVGTRKRDGDVVRAHVPDALQTVLNASLEAVSNYAPPTYEGRALLVVARERDPMMAEPESIWTPKLAKLETVMVGGDHRSMLQGDRGRELARLLSDAIDRVNPPAAAA